MVKAVKTIGLQRATLAGEVRGEIERMIVSGDLAAGEKLNELSLSNAMGRKPRHRARSDPVLGR